MKYSKVNPGIGETIVSKLSVTDFEEFGLMTRRDFDMLKVIFVTVYLWCDDYHSQIMSSRGIINFYTHKKLRCGYHNIHIRSELS